MKSKPRNLTCTATVWFLIDDFQLPGAGKGKPVIDYMISAGWRLHRYEYQALPVRG